MSLVHGCQFSAIFYLLRSIFDLDFSNLSMILFSNKIAGLFYWYNQNAVPAQHDRKMPGAFNLPHTTLFPGFPLGLLLCSNIVVAIVCSFSLACDPDSLWSRTTCLLAQAMVC